MAGVSVTEPSFVTGHMKRPFSSRLANRQKLWPSQSSYVNEAAATAGFLAGERVLVRWDRERKAARLASR